MKLMSQLMHCLLKFPAATKIVLAEYNITKPDQMDKLKAHQIASVVKKIRIIIGTRSIGFMTDLAKETILTGIQNGGTMAGMDLDGFRAEVLDDEVFHNIADEWSLDLIDLIYVHPKWKMGVYLATKIAKVHAENTGTKQAKALINNMDRKAETGNAYRGAPPGPVQGVDPVTLKPPKGTKRKRKVYLDDEAEEAPSDYESDEDYGSDELAEAEN